MRPARIIAAVTLAAAVVVTGSYLAVSTAHPSAAAPTAAVPPHPSSFRPHAQSTSPRRRSPPQVVPSLTGYRPLGRSWPTATTTATSAPSTPRNRLVVDLVQVFHDQAAGTRPSPMACPATPPSTWTSMSATRTRGCGPCRWPATCGWTCAR